MKPSVIVTTYNRPDALAAVLDGLKHQSQPPGEILVADDGSKSDTAEVITHAAGQCPFPIHHVWHPDQGFRAARIRNQSITKSVGKYIILLDGDCIPERHFIADHIALAQKGCFFQGKRVLVFGKQVQRFMARSAGLPTWPLLFESGLGNRHHLIRLPMLPAHHDRSISGIRSCNMGFFRSDILAVNGFNQDYEGWGREDSDLAIRFYKYGLKRRQHGFRAICFHLWHPENSRADLARNDRLLQSAMASDRYECKNGLVQK